ncbi:hypothetical protein STRDD11_01628 [Streptococcus sp. DD11]|nr:hypothetical protein STRDD11_01628 [Streptococcus sp. DD11]
MKNYDGYGVSRIELHVLPSFYSFVIKIRERLKIERKIGNR